MFDHCSAPLGTAGRVLPGGIERDYPIPKPLVDRDCRSSWSGMAADRAIRPCCSKRRGVSEDSALAIDSRMRELGGIVRRRGWRARRKRSGLTPRPRVPMHHSMVQTILGEGSSRATL